MDPIAIARLLLDIVLTLVGRDTAGQLLKESDVKLVNALADKAEEEKFGG